MAIPAAGRRPGARDATDAASAAPSRHLTAAIARGDEGAFAEFYEIWFDRVFAMARSATRRDESFCLDVVQDCMMRVVKSMRPLPSERAVAAWMARALFSTAVDRLRQDRRRALREREVAARVGAESSGDSVEEQERLDWLEARLAELPSTDRELMRERFESGKTLEAIGADQGMSGHAVHGRIWRIVARLKRAATREFSHD